VFGFFENGLRAPAYTALLAFLILFAGILYGGRVAWAITGICLLVNIFIAIGEMNGHYLTEPTIPDIRWTINIFLPPSFICLIKH
jgi:hypothetical protein